MNQCLFIGRLTADPELCRTDSGKVYTHFVVAVPRAFRNSKTDKFDTDFIRITCFEGLAEAVCNHTRKASMVCCKCRAVPSFRTIGEQKIYTIDFIGEMINFISVKENQSAIEVDDDQIDAIALDQE